MVIIDMVLSIRSLTEKYMEENSPENITFAELKSKFIESSPGFADDKFFNDCLTIIYDIQLCKTKIEK